MKTIKFFILTLAAVLLFSGVASAQYVFLARKALGAVKQLTSPDQGYAVATVLLNADAEKVYRAAVRLVSESSRVRLVKKDDASRTVEFTDGHQSATLKSAYLQPDTTQLLVACFADKGKSVSPAPVVESILRICHEMNVPCEVSPD
jgi:hypothetical protein